jgi:hypothetical protein
VCGIVGIYRKKGLRVAEIERFTEMLARCQSRGTHATGVFNNRLHYLKAPIKADEFIEMREYNAFKKHSIGCKYIIGHCRLSTRGKPEITRNDHPLFDEKKRFFLVHNGILSCTKFDKTPEEVDTSIFVHVIGENINASNHLVDTLDIIVDKAFCIIEKEATLNSSVIVVGNHDKIVFCKNKDRPLLWQSQDDDIIVFGSETTIIEEKDNGKPFNVLQDYAMQYIDLKTGKIDGRDLKYERKSCSRRDKTVMHGKDQDAYNCGGKTHSSHWYRSGNIVDEKYEYDRKDQDLDPTPEEDLDSTPEEEKVENIYEEICTDCVYADINYVDNDKTTEKDVTILDDVTRCEISLKVVNVKVATTCKEFISKF